MRDWPLRSDMIRTLGTKGPTEGKAKTPVRKKRGSRGGGRAEAS